VKWNAKELEDRAKVGGREGLSGINASKGAEYCVKTEGNSDLLANIKKYSGHEK